MIKTLAAAAVLSLGLAGYAVAQEPAAAPAAPMAAPMHHHHHHHHSIIITTTITCTTIGSGRGAGQLPRNKQTATRWRFEFALNLRALRTTYLSGELFFVRR